MRFRELVAAGMAAAMTVAANPALAIDNQADAEKVRQLNYMLMVSSLQCRFGEDDFQSEYNTFVAAHARTLDAAGDRIKQNMAARYGARGSVREFDRLNTRMANAYGTGHPWMECNELKSVTTDLSRVRSESELLEAADWLLASERGPSDYRLARR